ncbi:MAG: hypothetical protein ACE5LH_08215, partial [Fidelibacterota bacterium]
GYLGYQIRALAGDDQPIELTSQAFERANYGSIVYGKTAVFTRFLQHYLGEETMNRVMTDYYENWKFKHPSPDDFKSAFLRNVDEDLSWYFDDVITGTRVVDYAVVSLKNGEATVANRGSLVSPVELAFYGPKGEELERRWIPGFMGEKSVPVPRNTHRVVIDPDNYMPDIRRSNNSTSKPLKVNFVFDQPTFHNLEVNLMPWIGWNMYNGTTPGLVAYSGFLPGYLWGFSVSPQWDFQHNRPAGAVSARRIFTRALGFRSLTLTGAAADYSGRQGVKLGVEGVLRKGVVSTPVVRVNGAVFFHRIRPDAVDTTFYDSGEHRVVSLGYSYGHRPNPFRNYSAEGGVVAGFRGGGFARIHLEGELRWRYSKKLATDVRAWIGGFVLRNTVPAQYRIWMSGGVDPDFEDRWVFNRTKNPEGPFNVYREQFIPFGPSLRGYTAAFSTATAWGLNVDQTLPFVPGGLFADVGGATDLEEVFVDGGLKISAGFLSLYVPLYQSWDTPSHATDLKWLRSRIRFEISLGLGSIVIG